jgi:hypothetical protein
MKTVLITLLAFALTGCAMTVYDPEKDYCDNKKGCVAMNKEQLERFAEIYQKRGFEEGYEAKHLARCSNI